MQKLLVLLQPVQQRLKELPANDKRALLIMSVTIAVALAYFLVSGTYSYQQKSISFYKSALEDARWINVNKDQIKTLTTSQSVTSNTAGLDESLIAVATATAKSLGISFKRVQPEGDTGLRLWIEATPFDGVMKWIDALAKQGIVLEQLDVDRLEKQIGMVDARILIKRD
jgi:general secretion pathway protein M